MSLAERMKPYMADLTRAAELNQKPGPRRQLRQRQAEARDSIQRIAALELEDRLADREAERGQ